MRKLFKIEECLRKETLQRKVVADTACLTVCVLLDLTHEVGGKVLCQSTALCVGMCTGWSFLSASVQSDHTL